jgi:predicted  nucleic acid-binding Zn-ribbon protein
MATLDEAATQALDDVNALTSELDQTEEQIDDLREQLADAKQRLEEDWSDLHEQLEDTLSAAEAQAHLVRDGAATVEAAVGHLKATAEPLAGEVEALLERAKAELAAFGHWCEERNAELAAKAEKLTAATEAAQHAAEESERQTAEAGEEARDLLEQFGLQLESFHEAGAGGEQVTPVDRYRMLREAHLERIQPQIEEQVRGLLEEIGDAREALQAALEESNQLAEDAIDQGEAELQDQHQQFLDELKQKAEAAREAILALTQEVEQQADQVQQDSEATAGHSDHLHGRLSGASETVSEVLELLSRFSFVRFLRG